MGGVILPSPCLSAVSCLSLVPYTQLHVPKPLAVLAILGLRLDDLCLGMCFRVSACR